jgi:hypothetical protein
MAKAKKAARRPRKQTELSLAKRQYARISRIVKRLNRVARRDSAAYQKYANSPAGNRDKGRVGLLDYTIRAGTKLERLDNVASRSKSKAVKAWAMQSDYGNRLSRAQDRARGGNGQAGYTRGYTTRVGKGSGIAARRVPLSNREGTAVPTSLDYAKGFLRRKIATSRGVKAKAKAGRRGKGASH